jgi:hypothetical protein
MADEAGAWKEMRKYNKRDVVATEKVYLRMRPWIDAHPNLGVGSSAEKPVCPRCGSKQVQLSGTRTTQAGRYPRFQCVSCGGWSKGKTMLMPLAERRRLLVPA